MGSFSVSMTKREDKLVQGSSSPKNHDEEDGLAISGLQYDGERTYEVLEDTEKDFLLGGGSVSTYKLALMILLLLIRHTLGTSSDPHKESNEEQAESDEHLDPKGLEEGVLEGRIGREHQSVGSLQHHEQESTDDENSDALLVSHRPLYCLLSTKSKRRHTWRTFPARKTNWEVPRENIPSSPTTSADSPPATSHSPPICMSTRSQPSTTLHIIELTPYNIERNEDCVSAWTPKAMNGTHHQA
jgi:hypothetical protein